MTQNPPDSYQFTCEQCGALQAYVPGSQALECPFCGHSNHIEHNPITIREYPLHDALEQLASAPPAEERIVTQCQSCAAEFGFDEHVHAGECPFCGTPIVTGTGHTRHIKPKSLLPFHIDEQQAREAFRKWLGKLWFAPGKLREYARSDTRLTGVYVPYWTYDSHTESSYSGERGDVYYVTVPVTQTVNGKTVTRMRRVPKIRWSRVRGTVNRGFDDVLVGATKSLPRKITDAISPWDLQSLVAYDERYLSGFRSEVYQVGLEQGFDLAAEIMERVIRRDVARDIGGDQQRIHQVNTRHYRTTFKHMLLPVWSAAFRYRSEIYRFVINGRTGKVQGERPYSIGKIALTVIGGLIAAGVLIFIAERTGLLEELMRGY